MAVNNATGYNRTTNEPLDALFLNTGSVYTSTTEVNSKVNITVRYTGSMFNVNGELYWYKDGVQDGDLILFSVASASYAKTASGADRFEIRDTPNATVDTDKFLVSDSGSIKYRTGAEMLSDINAQPSGSYITSLTNEVIASGPGAASATLLNAAVIGKVLTGLNVTGGSIVATDSILTAFGKAQNQINGLMGGAMYQGVWNASTNSPTITSSTGTKGHYYVVNVAGSTNIDGITDWKVGDWIIFNGVTWDKVDNTDAVSSVNGYVGSVSLVTGDILEGAGTIPGRPSQLFFTDVRARAAVSAAGTGLTYNSSTGVFTWTNPGYITGNQTITLSGHVTGSGATSISTTIANGVVTTAMMASANISQWTNDSGYITSASVGNGTLTMNVSGNGLSGSQTFTANQSGAATFTVTSNATNANTGSTIVFRDASGNFSAGTITAALSGNASTATIFSTDRTDYKGVTDGAVAGQLMWKEYGNNHTIFDASDGTAPDGTAVNNTNSAVAWSATYPTLMGWNGSTTYGVRVDSARVAGDSSTLQGYSPAASATANTIALRTSDGDIFVRLLRTEWTSGEAGTGGYILMQNAIGAGAVDNYARPTSMTTLRGYMGLGDSDSTYMRYQGFGLDANTILENRTGFTYSVNAPYTGPILYVGAASYGLQLNASYSGGGEGLAFRTRNGDTASWNGWNNVWHEGNINPVPYTGATAHVNIGGWNLSGYSIIANNAFLSDNYYRLSGTPMMAGTSTYTLLYSQTGTAAIYLGGAIDPANYYDNTTHFFRNIGGGATYATIQNGLSTFYGETQAYNIDNTNRTLYRDILYVTAQNGALPYDGHGGGILFRGATYHTSSNVPYARIGTIINSNSTYTYGSTMFFDIATNSGGSMARAFELYYTGNAKFFYDLTVSGTGTFGTRTRVGGGYITDIGGTGNHSGIAFGSSGIYPIDGNASYSSTKDLGYDSLPWRSLYMSNAIRRTNPLGGYLNGGYAGTETTTTPGLIYAIGDSYLPTSSALAAMYGVGYTHDDFAGGPLGQSGWGLYVADAGNMRHWLGSDAYRTSVPIVNTSASASSFSGNITAASMTVSAGGTLGIVSGDLWIMNNGGFGILSANANRAIAITNTAVGLNYTLNGTNFSFFTSGASDYVGKILATNTGGSKLVFLAGVSGVSNGFTVTHNGTNMVYTMAHGGLTINGALTTNDTINVGPNGGSVASQISWTGSNNGLINLYNGGLQYAQIIADGNSFLSGPISANYFDAVYSSAYGNYNGSFDWNVLQLGNNGPNYIVGGHAVGGGWLDFYTNNTNRVPGTTPNGTHVMRMNTSGTVDVHNTVTAPNFADFYGSYNVNLGSGGLEGRGLVAGFSGGSYAGIGYNIRHTSSSATWTAPGGDAVSYILFNAGFTFMYAAGGAAGRDISGTLGRIARLESWGDFKIKGALFPGYDNASSYAEQGSYYLYGNTANQGLRTNGNFLVNGDVYVGASGMAVWLSSWLNQSVKTDAAPTFADVYVNSWFRNNTSGAGLYNVANDTHFYSSSTVQWDFASAGGSYIQIGLRPGGHATTVRGYLYADTGYNIGFLHGDGNWSLRMNNSKSAVIAGGISDVSGHRTVIPKGGTYVTGSSSATGAIKIRLPIPGAAPMMVFNVNVYEYITGKTFTVKIAGHTSGGFWYNTSAYAITDLGNDERNINVRFGTEGGYYCVWIGETGTSWSYPQVWVTDVQIGYSSLSDAWAADWLITLETTLGSISQTRTCYGHSTVGGAYTPVRRDSNGYIFSSYFNTSSGGAERNASGMGYFAGFNSSDYYIRSYTPTAARIAMGLATTDNVTFNQVTATLIGISSGVTVNYNNDSASTYQMLWGSGNYVYGTAGIYCNPSTDTIYANGNIIAYASSDSRYKDNQQLITNPIGKLLALRGMTFTWNNLQQDFKGNDYGLIYQDVTAVMPEITQMRENGYGAIKYEKVIPLLVEVGKNHEQRIQELENKLQAYENKFGKLN